VKIPGFRGELHDITKASLPKLRYAEAEVICPKCGKAPSLQVEHRMYVCENPDDKYVAAGHQVTPFDAPNIITPAYLVEASTKYNRTQDFVNFNLGLPMEDSEATLGDEDFNGKFELAELGQSVVYVMGVDVGNVYHFTIAAVDPYDDMCVVHTEQVPMRHARTRYFELRRQFLVICTVIDSTPHSETVQALQNDDQNLYASVYMRSKSVLTHNIAEKDEVKAEGKGFQRQVNVNRNVALDGYMQYLRDGHLSWKATPEQEVIIAHHKSMKRVKTFDAESGEMVFTWQKSDGNDHYHHSHLYCWIAGKIRGVGRPSVVVPTALVHKFQLKDQRFR
jgi:hypothetical protein